MDKFITAKDAVEKIQDGMTIMVGGFLAVGTPISLIDMTCLCLHYILFIVSLLFVLKSVSDCI